MVAPLLYLTVTVETEGDGSRVHLHPGGQGFWIARMLGELGCDCRLVAPVGGEAGAVLEGLMPGWNMDLAAVQTSGSSAVQVQDRRSGERIDIVDLAIEPLDRHDADDLYGACLHHALSSDALVMTSGGDTVLPDEALARLASDVYTAGRPLIADVHGSALDAILAAAPLDVLKVSEDDLGADGWAVGDESQAINAARSLVERGARTVVVSRAGSPAVAAVGDRVVRVVPPPLSAIDHRGVGDSMTGAISAGHLLGLDPLDAIRLGAAAGAGNVTRHGLGSGSHELILELARLVEVEDIG